LLPHFLEALAELNKLEHKRGNAVRNTMLSDEDEEERPSLVWNKVSFSFLYHLYHHSNIYLSRPLPISLGPSLRIFLLLFRPPPHPFLACALYSRVRGASLRIPRIRMQAQAKSRLPRHAIARLLTAAGGGVAALHLLSL
jgi:hypothetical protein